MRVPPSQREASGRTTDHRYRWEGEAFRVVVAGDVVSLPRENWSGEGYGHAISEEWLFHERTRIRFPGATKARRRLLAYMVRRALADHHGYALERGAWPGPGPEPEIGT